MPKPKKRTPPARREDPAVDAERQHDDAMRVLRKEYWDGVRGIVEDLKQRVASKEIDTEEGLQDAVHQAVDGSYWVIYTHANFQVLMCSDHHDAYSEEYGEAPVEGSDIKWAALAYAALERDVQDQMGAEGVEVVEERRVREARRVGWDRRVGPAAHETRRVIEPRRLDSRLRGAPRRSVRAPAGRRPRRR